jgi:hypothetical protein
MTSNAIRQIRGNVQIQQRPPKRPLKFVHVTEVMLKTQFLILEKKLYSG